MTTLLVRNCRVGRQADSKADQRAYRGVADLMNRSGRGSSKVVWAGVGRRSNGLGEGEMHVLRNSVMEERSRRLQLEKLGGIKPYSRHGF